MQLATTPFENICGSEFEIIYKELGVDEEKVKHVIKLVKDWLKSETHLPDTIDEDLLENFVLKCKGNFEKTKTKIENYLAARTEMEYFFADRAIKNEPDLYMIHRAIIVSKKLSNDGNRIIIMRFPSKDPTHLNHLKACKYFILVLEALLYHDKCAGYHFVFDAENANLQAVGKVNLALQKNLLQLMYITLPFRVRSVHVVNGNTAFDVFLNIAKLFMSQKLKDRLVYGKSDELSKYFSKECLPKDYGGEAEVSDETCDEWLEVLKENKKWCEETEKLKLTGPLPGKTKALYSFEAFSMEGSFRNLNLD